MYYYNMFIIFLCFRLWHLFRIYCQPADYPSLNDREMDKKRKCCHRIKSVFGEKNKIKSDSVFGDQRQDDQNQVAYDELAFLTKTIVRWCIQIFLKKKLWMGNHV